jgi:hypothetical protein
MSEALGSVPYTAKKNRAEGLVAWLKWYSPYQQVKGLEFNPQYHQKKKKKKDYALCMEISQWNLSFRTINIC